MLKPSISLQQVQHLARLACMDLDDVEARRMVADIGVILDYMSVLRTADLDDVSALEREPLELRDDEPCTGAGVAGVDRRVADPFARGVPDIDARVRGPGRGDS